MSISTPPQGANVSNELECSPAGQGVPELEKDGNLRVRQNVGNGERLVSILGGLGLGLYGLSLSRGKLTSLLCTVVGGGFVYRGITGHCYCYEAAGVSTANQHSATAVPARKGHKLEKAVTINCDPRDIYQRWRDLESLPKLMTHLKSVKVLDDKRSHWTADGVFGHDHLEWDAEIINERENELLAWKSLPGGDVDSAGSIRLRPLSHSRGTEVFVQLKYNPPAGKLGAHVAAWLGDGLDQKLDEDLRRFKQILETGEVASIDGQPRGAYFFYSLASNRKRSTEG